MRDALAGVIRQVYEHERRMAAVAVTVLADETLHERFRDMLARAPVDQRSSRGHWPLRCAATSMPAPCAPISTPMPRPRWYRRGASTTR